MSMEICEQSETMSMEIRDEYLISCSRLVLENYKRMLSEEDSDSSRDSNSSRDSDSSSEERHKSTHSKESDSDSSTDSSGSPPHKRPRRLLVFTSFEELKKIDVEEILPKVFVDWFMSLGAKANENDILRPEYYGEWFMTLETEAKADVLHPFIYTQWYVLKFNKVEPNKFPSTADLIQKYGQPALEYFNKINKCDYEYVRDVALSSCDYSYHLNFYGRLKVSPSRPESEAPQILFFADVDVVDGVLECCILDPNEFGDATVLHPPDFYCPECNGDCAPI